MLQDAQGLDVTTDSPVAIAAINRFIEQSLSYGKEAESVILKGISGDPSCAMVHAYAAAYFLSQENAEDWQHAKPHLTAAQKHLGEVTERERLYIQAIVAWAAGRVDQASVLHEAIAARYPQDLISVQQGQYHYFYLGKKERLLKIAEKVLPANQQNHYLYGMVAFGLEQCHQLEEAEAMGRRATAMNRYDPWAHHAVAHVMETQQRISEGIAWMENLANTWENCNSMLYTHNWWHIALYYLEQGDTQKVLNLYDTHVWGRARQESPKDQVGAIALLLRLELKGISVGDRWQQLSIYLKPRIHEHALPFQDLHYIYALARAGQTDQVTEMLQSMEAHANKVSSCLRRSWLEVAIPAANAMIAHATGHWSETIAQLKPVLSKLWSIGGSHAQRVLFEQIYQNALKLEESSQEIQTPYHSTHSDTVFIHCKLTASTRQSAAKVG